MPRKVLVAGAQGVIGRAAATHLAARSDTQVLGLSRRTEPSVPNVEAVSVDLLEPKQVRERLGGIRDVTHIVFGAYIEKQTPTDKSTVNVAILRNLLDVVEETSPGLRHVTFYQGGKAYGADLGPFKTPAPRGRSAADASELLLRPGRSSARAPEGQGLVVHGPSTRGGLRLRRG